MKISLVVATGVHKGRVIPVAGQEFLIGRDPHCQLRPASPAISKQHCGVFVRGGKVFVKDFGSTNGTFLNDAQVDANAEVEVKTGDRLRAGPLDFAVQLAADKPSDSTPLPDSLKMLEPAAAAGLADAAGQKKPASAAAVKPVEAPKPQPQPIPGPKETSEDEDAAAMLLGMGEDPVAPSDVPGGSTIMDMVVPTVGGAADDKKDKKAGSPTREDTSSAASEILRRYMRRPK